eukprot:6236802-Amphidinium_carterae.1
MGQKLYLLSVPHMTAHPRCAGGRGATRPYGRLRAPWRASQAAPKPRVKDRIDNAILQSFQ